MATTFLTVSRGYSIYGHLEFSVAKATFPSFTRPGMFIGVDLKIIDELKFPTRLSAEMAARGLASKKQRPFISADQKIIVVAPLDKYNIPMVISPDGSIETLSEPKKNVYKAIHIASQKAYELGIQFIRPRGY